MREKSGYKWRLAAFLFFASALNYGDRTAITALFPLLQKEFALTDVGLGFIGSAFLWSYAICAPVAGLLADRFSRQKLVIFSLFAWSAVTALTGMVHSPRALWTMRGLLGVVESLYIPASVALLAEHHPVATRAKAIALHIAGLSVGMVAGGSISGYLGDYFGWRVPLLLLGGIGAVLAIVGYFIVCETGAPAAAKPQAAGDLRSSLAHVGRALLRPPVLVLFFEYMFMGAGVWGLIHWLPKYFNETFGMTLGKAALFATLFLQSGATLGILLGGVPSDHFARKNISGRMMLFGVFYLLASPLMLVFLFQPGVWTIAAAVFLYGLLRAAGQINSNPLICELLPPQARSTAIGMTNMLACLAGGAGVMVAGALKQSLGLAGVFASITFVTAACGGLLLLVARRWMAQDAAASCEPQPALEAV